MTFFVTLTAAGKPTKFDNTATVETADPGAIEMSDDVALALAAEQFDHHYDVASGTIVADEVVEPSKDDLVAYVRSKSYAIRIGGTTINGVSVKTDTDTITMVNGLWNAANDDPKATFYFDPGTGEPIQLSATDAITLARAFSTWVQGTFKTRSDLLGKVAAGTLTTTADIDAAFTAASS